LFYLLIILFDGSGDINFSYCFALTLVLCLFSFFFAFYIASTTRFTMDASIFDHRIVCNVQGIVCIIFTSLLLFSLHSN